MSNEDLEKVLADLIHEYALMWAGEWGFGEDSWPEMLIGEDARRGSTAIFRALDALGLTWEEFVAARGATRVGIGWRV